LSLKITIDDESVELTKASMLDDFKKYLVQPLLSSTSQKIDRIDDNYDLDSIKADNSNEKILAEYKKMYKEVLEEINKIKLNELVEGKKVLPRFEFLMEIPQMGNLKIDQLDSSVARKLLGDVAETQEAEVALKMGLDDYDKYFEELYEEPREEPTDKSNRKKKELVMNETERFTELDKFKTLKKLGFTDISISEPNVDAAAYQGKLNPSPPKQAEGGGGRTLFYQNVIPIYRGKATSPLGPNSEADSFIYAFGISYEKTTQGKKDVELYKTIVSAIKSINAEVDGEESFRETYVDEFRLEINRIKMKDRKAVNEFEQEFDVTVQVTEDGKEITYDKKGRTAVTKPKRFIDYVSQKERNKMESELSKIKTKSLKEIYKEASEKKISPILANKVKELVVKVNNISKQMEGNLTVQALLGLPEAKGLFDNDEQIEALTYQAFREASQKNKVPEMNMLPESVGIKQNKISFPEKVRPLVKPITDRKKDYIEREEAALFYKKHKYTGKGEERKRVLTGKEYFDQNDIAKEAYTNTKEFLNKHLEPYMNDLSKVYKYSFKGYEITDSKGKKTYEINRIQALSSNINFKGGGRFTAPKKRLTTITRGEPVLQDQQLNTVILSMKRRLKNLKLGLE